MPNIGAVLKAEIARLSRKEARNEVETTRKMSAQHRRYIATLKSEIARLDRQVSLLDRRVGELTKSVPAATTEKPLRFVAKGFRSQRERLGLSAAECARLIGVSAQTIYNWEHKVAVPRREQLVNIAALRGIGKREARARLEQLDGSQGG